MMTTGYFYVFSFLVMGSATDVYLSSYFQRHDPVFTAFLTFLFGILYFQCSLGREMSDVIYRIQKEWKLFLALNTMTAINWLGFFWSLKFIEPAVSGAIAFALIPTISIVIARSQKQRDTIGLPQVLSSLGICLSVGLLSYGAIIEGTSQLGYSRLESGIGVALSLAAAFGMSVNTFITKRLSGSGFKSNEVMAFRFLILTAVAGLTTASAHKSTIYDWDIPYLVEMLALSVAIVILPMYLIQKGIEKSEPITVSILLSLTPAITLLFETLGSRHSPAPLSIAGIIFCCFFAVYGVRAQAKQQEAEMQN